MTTDTVDRRRLWERVSEDLERQLGDEGRVAGHRLDSEAALCRRYAVSRVTLRQALSQLERRGLVHSRPGRGWYVGPPPQAPAAPPVSEDAGVLKSFTEMASSLGLQAGAVVLHCDRRPAGWEEAQDLAVAPGAELLSLRRLRRLDGHPIAVDHSLVPAGLLEGADASEFADGSLYAALRRRGVHPVRADYEIQAVAADAEHAELLEVAEGAPLLTARQLSVDHRGRRVERGLITYRGDRYRFRAVLLAAPPATST